MPKYCGLNPEHVTRKTIEQFENDILIRHNNQQLVSSVYVDMQENQWAVGFAYNLSRNPGLYGHEHSLEVRYLYRPKDGNLIRIFRSDSAEETVLEAGGFSVPDTFVRYAITHERRILNRPA